eukprot:933291-Prorocentrum_minimum.AAC.1
MLRATRRMLRAIMRMLRATRRTFSSGSSGHSNPGGRGRHRRKSHARRKIRMLRARQGGC